MNSSSIPYQKSLDGIRGLAILLVMLTHQQIITFGWVGVQLFLVLSGYLITRILLKEKEKQIPTKTKLKNFWTRRILRIFPVYYLYLITLLLVWLFFSQANEFSNELSFLLTYTYNFYLSKTLDFDLSIRHLWSLSVEEQFYLFYPFVVFFLQKKYLKIIIISLIIFSICFRFLYSEHLKSVFTASDEILIEKTHYLTFSQLDFFLSGAAIVIFRLDKLKVASQNILFFLSFLAMIVSGLILFILMYDEPFCTSCFLKDFGFQFGSMKFQWPYIVLNLFLFSLILILVTERRGKLSHIINKIFSLRLLVSIGKISYGMYVIHLGISHLLSLYKYKIDFISNGYILFVVYVLIVYLLSLLIYEVYEKKFLALKERFR